MRPLLFLLAAVVVVSGCSKTITPKYSIVRLTRHQAPAVRQVRVAAKPSRSADGLGISWSGDGSRLAFSWSQGPASGLGVTDGTYWKDIALVESDTAGARLGSRGPIAYWDGGRIFYISNAARPDQRASAAAPKIVDADLSPDGRLLACTALTEADAGRHLAFCEIPGLTCTLAEGVPVDVRCLSWSPKGDRIALFGHPLKHRTDGNQGSIYIYRPSDRTLSRLVADRWTNRHSWNWSSDGKSIYFAENGDQSILVERLWAVDVDSGTQELLADLSRLDLRVLAALPSPDGLCWLLVAGKNQGPHTLYLLDLPKASLSVLATGNLWLPVWSPKGDRFAVAVNGNMWFVSRSDMKATQVIPRKEGEKT